MMRTPMKGGPRTPNTITPRAAHKTLPAAYGGTAASAASSVNTSTSSTGSAAAHSGNDTSNNIKVYVRLRAFNAAEKQKWIPNDLAVRMKDATCEVTVPGRGKFPFTFDDCFWSNDMEEEGKPYVSQSDLFETVGRPLVENALMGFNSAIIAYGQTGSGKTYSIFGPHNDDPEQRGLIPRVCDEIFSKLQGGAFGAIHSVSVSMLEVYLEEVFDLLNGRKKLIVRQDSPTSFAVVGSKQYTVQSYNEVLHLIQKGDSLKTFASTALNERSSRAHTLFQLELRTTTETGSRTARVLLADLAGCERIKLAKTDHGTALDEACNINLSLLTLGTCIEAAVQRSKQGKTIEGMGEFRQSTLTKLLKDYIGGNSRTAMLVAIAPALKDVNLTLQALRFADRAKQIQNHAKINHVAQSNPNVAGEAIRIMYDRKKELLEKECELEVVYATIKRKQSELADAAKQLEEEKRVIEERRLAYLTSDDEKKMLTARLAEIESQMKGLSRELSDSERHRDDLEARLLEVCGDNAVIVSNKEALEKKIHELTMQLETTRNEHAEEVLQQEMETESLCGELAQWQEKYTELEQQKLLVTKHFTERNEITDAKIRKLEEALRAVTEERESALERATSTETKLSQVEGEVAMLKEKLAQAAKSEETMQQTIKKITQERDNGAESIAALEKKLKEQSEAHAEAMQKQQRAMSVSIENHELELKGEHDRYDALRKMHREVVRNYDRFIEMTQAKADTLLVTVTMKEKLLLNGCRDELSSVISAGSNAITEGQQEYKSLQRLYKNTISLYDHMNATVFRATDSMILSVLTAKEEAMVSGIKKSLRSTAENFAVLSKEEHAKMSATVDELSARLRSVTQAAEAAEMANQSEVSRRETVEEHLKSVQAELERTRSELKATTRDLEATKEDAIAEISELKLEHAKVLDSLQRERDEQRFSFEAAAKRERLNEQLRADLLAQQCQAAKKMMEAALMQYENAAKENGCCSPRIMKNNCAASPRSTLSARGTNSRFHTSHCDPLSGMDGNSFSIRSPEQLCE